MRSTVLIAGRDSHYLDTIAREVSVLGLDCAHAATAEETMGIVRSRPLLATCLDHDLGDTTGIAAVPLIHAVVKGLPCVCFVREPTKEALRRALAAGAFTVLGKPPEREVFAFTMQTILDRAVQTRGRVSWTWRARTEQ